MGSLELSRVTDGSGSRLARRGTVRVYLNVDWIHSRRLSDCSDNISSGAVRRIASGGGAFVDFCSDGYRVVNVGCKIVSKTSLTIPTIALVTN